MNFYFFDPENRSKSESAFLRLVYSTLAIFNRILYLIFFFLIDVNEGVNHRDAQIRALIYLRTRNCSLDHTYQNKKIAAKIPSL